MKWPAPGSNAELEQIRHDVRSDQQEIRGRAMQALLMWARKDPRIHQAALPIFRASLENVQDAWTATSAVRGVECIVGPSEGRSAWLALLDHPRAEVTARVALALEDASYSSVLLELLERRPETPIQSAVIRTLGRLHEPAALPAILRCLAVSDLRPDAIEALADLGDASAIPHLEPLLHDTTESGIQDDRGWMLSVCDLANVAILRLRAAPKPGGTAGAQSGFRPEPQQGPTTTIVVRPKPHPAAYVPLAAGVLEIPWFAAILFMQLFRTGTISTSPAETHRLDLIAMIPAVAGLLTGIVVVARGKSRRLVERICLGVGCLGCGLAVFSFGWEFFH